METKGKRESFYKSIKELKRLEENFIKFEKELNEKKIEEKLHEKDLHIIKLEDSIKDLTVALIKMGKNVYNCRICKYATIYSELFNRCMDCHKYICESCCATYYPRIIICKPCYEQYHKNFIH